MSIHDFASQRLFLDAPLEAGCTIACTHDQANYLRNVLRMGSGTTVLVFNGRDGEWRATLDATAKRGANLHITEQTRAQTTGPDIDYLFAPLKRSRLDYMVQKVTEMGVARLRPVITQHTIAERVNSERMRANAIEAAEQCGVLRVPDVSAPERLENILANWVPSRTIIFCDERASEQNPIARLGRLAPSPVAVLIGPEGGFSADERASLTRRSFVVPISLGPRIMRADTAAVAALAIVNAVLGDWR